MKLRWGYLIGIVVVALLVGLLFPEWFGSLQDPQQFSLDAPLTNLPDPPWWVLIAAALTAVVSLLYPSDAHYERASSARKKKDVAMTRSILTYLMVGFLFPGLYLFIWVGWSVRSILFE